MRNFVIFLVGAAIGGVTGWLVTKRHYKMKIESMVKEKIYSDDKVVKIAHDKDVENASVGECEKYISDFMTDIFEGREEDAIHFLADQLEKFGATVTDAYGENADQYYEDVNPVEEDEDDESPSDSDENDSIYEIDQKEFCEKNLDFSKEQIDYYDGDSTFVDLESGEVVDKWRQYFGDDILNWIEDHNWRKGSLYVRNMALSSDYQIIFKETSYSAASGESENEEDYNAGDFADRRR